MWALELLWLVRPWLDFFPANLPNLVLFILILCVLVPRLNSGRLAVYSCDRAHGNLQV